MVVQRSDSLGHGTGDPAVYAHYVGEYKAENGQIFTVESRVSGLCIEGPLEQHWQLLPLAEDEYFVQLNDLKFKFERNDSGQVTALIEVRSGQTTRAKRIE